MRILNSRGRAAVVVLVTFLAACHNATAPTPTYPIDGLWNRGGVSGDHSGDYFLKLTQNGTEIRGYACYADFNAPSEKMILFHDLPVSGQYPRVEFTIEPGGPCCPDLHGIALRWVGSFTAHQTIEGAYVNSTGARTPMTLRRNTGAVAAKGCFTQQP